MEQHKFEGAAYQKWRLTSLGNGYYKITSVESGLALAVQAGSEHDSDTNLIQIPYADYSHMQWEFEETTDGQYKVRARSSINDLVMCANGSGTGANIQQDDYNGNNTGYLDEWHFELCSEYAHVTLQTYIYYDVLAGDLYTEAELIDFYETATEALLDDVYIDMEIIDVLHLPALDTLEECKQYNDPDSYCTSSCGPHYSEDSEHHRSISRLLRNEAYIGYYTCRIVGYRTCGTRNGPHGSVLGLAYQGQKALCISTKYGDGLTRVLQHELAHNLTNHDNDSCSDGSKCVLGSAKDSLCDGCVEAIRERFY